MPLQIGRLHNLTVLNVSNNRLTYLPQSIGILQSLKCLNVSYNKLLSLPGTFRFFRLMYLDMKMNKFGYKFNHDLCRKITVRIQIPTLVERSAKIFLTSRFLSFIVFSKMFAYTIKKKSIYDIQTKIIFFVIFIGYHIMQVQYHVH